MVEEIAFRIFFFVFGIVFLVLSIASFYYTVELKIGDPLLVIAGCSGVWLACICFYQINPKVSL